MLEGPMRFNVLRSSAGAGKTHALVTAYLIRCLETQPNKTFAPNGFRYVLALTFTNKAAGELQERVIQYLNELALLSSERQATGPMSSVLKALKEALAIDFKELQQRASDMLKHMLHDRSSVAISTIDAFTKKVTQPFTRELQLEWDQEMTTDTGYYNGMAVDTLLDLTELGSPESKIIMRACNELLENESKWDVRDPLKQIIKMLADESSLQHLRSYEQLSATAILQINKQLNERIQQHRRAWRETGKKGLAIINACGFNPREVSYGKDVLSLFTKSSEFDGKKPPANTNAFKFIHADLTSKKKYASDLLEKALKLQTALTPLAEETLQLQEAWPMEDFMANTIRKELMMVATLSDLSHALRTVKQQENVAYFSDLTQKIATVVQSEPTPFVYERIGERYLHILIDEFQDTSILQWQNLIPLVENALSNGGSALLVGDAKQAIYRWRNGEVRQFEKLPQIFRKELLVAGSVREHTLQAHFKEAPPLDHNYRSGSSIIAFNNAFFGLAKQGLSEMVDRIFQGHEQHAQTSRSGYVELRYFPKGPEKKLTQELRGEAMERVVEVITEAEEKGFAKSDITILVRSKKHGTFAADFLNEKGIQVSSAETFELGKDLKVQLIIEQLKFLDMATSTSAARIHALLETLQLRQDVFSFKDELIDVQRTAHNLLAPLATSRKSLSFYELVSWLIQNCGLDPSEDMMLLSLLDRCQEHGKYGHASIRDFIEAWERTHSKQGVQLAMDNNAVQIMTIHASKGLAKPIIIVPFVEMRSGGNLAEYIWINASAYGLEKAFVKHTNTLAEQQVPEALEENELRVLDELNTLYVAATRASHRLYMMAPGSNASPASKALVQFIETNGVDNVYKTGDPTERYETEQDHTEAIELTGLGYDSENKLVFRKEAPRDWQANAPDPYRTHGDRIHALFESLNTLSDFSSVFDQANAIAPFPTGLKEQLSKVLEKKEIGAFYEEGVKGSNEATILLGTNEFLRPDRVIVKGNTAKVLDIKTGVPRKTHKAQLAKYKKALSALGYEHVKGFLLYLKAGTLVEV